MQNKPNLEVLPEDKVQLSQGQKNLIELGLIKQIPPEDADFLESIKAESSNSTDSPNELFAKISAYFTKKYGLEFGIIYLAAIMGGEEKYNEAIHSVEELRATERMNKQNT